MQLLEKTVQDCLSFFYLLILTVYIFHLNSQVKAEFSNPLKLSNNVTQIEYSIDEYPKILINMLLLVEDQSFYNIMALTLKEIARVFMVICLRIKLKGGSTISQQLIKNSLLSREKTLSRKVRRGFDGNSFGGIF